MFFATSLTSIKDFADDSWILNKFNTPTLEAALGLEIKGAGRDPNMAQKALVVLAHRQTINNTEARCPLQNSAWNICDKIRFLLICLSAN